MLRTYNANMFRVVREGTSPNPNVVILIHGGFFRERYNWNNSYIDIFVGCVPLADTCVLVEYPRTDCGGGWPITLNSLLETIDDIRKELKTDVVHLAGHSAGSFLSISLICKIPHIVRSAICLAPVCDLFFAAREHLSDEGDACQRFLGLAKDDFSEFAMEKYNETSYVHELEQEGLSIGPIVFIGGEKDKNVPIGHIEHFLATLSMTARRRINFYIVPGDHFEMLDPNDVMNGARVKDILERTLKGVELENSPC